MIVHHVETRWLCGMPGIYVVRKNATHGGGDSANRREGLRCAYSGSHGCR
jgi:hypothetical protein